MERTRSRPLPSGKIAHPSVVFFLGLLLIALSLPLALQLNLQVALYIIVGALLYAGVYTLWLKKRSSWNIVIGGIAGSCAVLAGWLSIAGQLTAVPLLLALLLFFWTPTHFWSFAIVHGEDYRRAGIPMLPTVIGEKKAAVHILVATGVVVAISLLLYFWGSFGLVYLSGALLLGALFLFFTLRLQRTPLPEIAWQNYKFSGVYLLGLFLSLLLDITL
jgi:protoheme IX farnesyltransferase